MRPFYFIVLAVFFYALPLSAETINLVTSLDPLEAREYISAFERDSGVKVQWIRLSAGEVLARLKSESRHPTQDVWFGAPVPEFVAAKDAGLLEPFISKATRAIPEKWRDTEGFWTGVYFGAIVFISGKGIEPPKSWHDLLKPEYKGEIVVSYPYTAGTGYTILSGLTAIMGEEGALEYYKKLDGQIRRYTKSGGAPIIEVGLGEAGVGIVFEQDAIRKGVSRGFPITVTVPSDGVPYEVGGVAIIKGKRNADTEKFVDWIVSPSAQNLMQKWYRVPTHPSAKIAEGAHDPSRLKVADITMESAGLKREGLIRKWREKVQK